MSPERAERLYRSLAWLFPRTWRAAQEHEFVETLRDTASASNGFGVVAQTVDLLLLAAVLRRRELVDRFVRRRLRTDRSAPVIARPPDGVPVPGPATATLAFAIVLLAPVLHWSGEIPIEFVLTTLLVVAVPGIGVLYTVACAVAGGRSRGLVAAIGCTLGIVPHLVVAFLGLSGLLRLGATLFEAVRWAGVLYLAWMGVAMLRSGIEPRIDAIGEGEIDAEWGAGPVESADGCVPGAGSVILRGVLLNVLNPKLTLFFFAFLPQFLSTEPAGESVLVDPRLIGLGSLFMLLTLGGFVLYALAGAAARNMVTGTPRMLRMMQRTVGVLLLGFAARLALAER